MNFSLAQVRPHLATHSMLLQQMGSFEKNTTIATFGAKALNCNIDNRNMDSNISDTFAATATTATSAATATTATDIKGHWDLGPREYFFILENIHLCAQPHHAS